MKRRDRLARSSDFQRVLGAGRVYSAGSLSAFATPGSGPVSRVGVTVSRQVKGAVRRNRARRRLREVVRTCLLADDSPLRRPGITLDVVLIARPALLHLPFSVVEAEAAAALRRVGQAR